MKLPIALATTCLLAYLASANAVAYEEPAFTVAATVGTVEYRMYEPHLIAETVVADEADRDRAAGIAFRRLFDYISGDNRVRREIAMTTPVQQAPTSTKIAMTIPVAQSASPDGWRVSFVVPKQFDLTTVPEPNDRRVAIREVPARLVAVLAFSGRWSDANVDTHTKALLAALESTDVSPQGPVATAFYNAPFSLPFMRRNEVMVEVDTVPGTRVALDTPGR